MDVDYMHSVYALRVVKVLKHYITLFHYITKRQRPKNSASVLCSTMIASYQMVAATLLSTLMGSHLCCLLTDEGTSLTRQKHKHDEFINGLH